jgi:hypothetical protein
MGASETDLAVHVLASGSPTAQVNYLINRQALAADHRLWRSWPFGPRIFSFSATFPAICTHEMVPWRRERTRYRSLRVTFMGKEANECPHGDRMCPIDKAHLPIPSRGPALIRLGQASVRRVSGRGRSSGSDPAHPGPARTINAGARRNPTSRWGFSGLL